MVGYVTLTGTKEGATAPDVVHVAYPPWQMLASALQRAGMTDDEAARLMGGNMLRWRDMCRDSASASGAHGGQWPHLPDAEAAADVAPVDWYRNLDWA
jgi:hypothetical protein